MISQLFSTQSRKAWVAGVIATVLTPVIQLLAVGGEITLRSVLVALANGVISAAAVYLTANESDPALLPAERAAVTAATAAAATAAERAGIDAEPLHIALDDDFEGQTIAGE